MNHIFIINFSIQFCLLDKLKNNIFQKNYLSIDFMYNIHNYYISVIIIII